MREEAYHVMNKVTDILNKHKERDEFDMFGKHVAFQLRNISKRDQIQAKF